MHVQYVEGLSPFVGVVWKLEVPMKCHLIVVRNYEVCHQYLSCFFKIRRKPERNQTNYKVNVYYSSIRSTQCRFKLNSDPWRRRSTGLLGTGGSKEGLLDPVKSSLSGNLRTPSACPKCSIDKPALVQLYSFKKWLKYLLKFVKSIVWFS
ncbi:hypothetical protein TNCV_2516311 [Trichonephila clavipes]|nr:hypothetical protein TNCV_2516311 [Trichonephila clavipes]